MSDTDDIPVLTDLVEPGPEFTLSDLGFEEDSDIDPADTAPGDFPFPVDNAAPVASASADISPALEQAVRRILDEHMELAWQEIRLAIQQHLDRS